MHQKMTDKIEKETFLNLIKKLDDENEELYRHNVQLTRRLQEKRSENELVAGFEMTFEKLGLHAPPFSNAKRLLSALTEKISTVGRSDSSRVANYSKFLANIGRKDQ